MTTGCGGVDGGCGGRGGVAVVLSTRGGVSELLALHGVVAISTVAVEEGVGDTAPAGVGTLFSLPVNTTPHITALLNQWGLHVVDME